MQFIPTSLPEVTLIKPDVHGDDRGFFMETYQQTEYRNNGIDLPFVQDNHSHSEIGTLRGLHYQLTHPQGKLVRVVAGEIYDAAVDLRRASPRFGQWVGVILSAENRDQLWIPPGFAHGFLTLSSFADVLYKTTEFYLPSDERSIRWNDESIGITWPLDGMVRILLSERDREAPGFKHSEVFP